MLALALGVVVAASPLKIAVTGVSVTGINPAEGQAFIDFFAQRFGDALGSDVVTPTQVAGVVGLERQKQMLGCSDASSSCLAELAGAMGVDFIVTGTMAKLDGGFTVSLKLIEVSSAKAKLSAATRVTGANALSDFLEQTARAWGRELKPGAPPLGPLPIVLGAVTAGLAITSGVFFGLSQAEAARLRRHDDFTASAQIASAASFGRTSQTLGWLFGGLTAAGVVGTVLAVVLGAPAGNVAFWSAPDGGGLIVRGELP